MQSIDLKDHPASGYFNYTGARTSQISFPLGGIGTGSIGLAGNGRLIDWEIYNRPNKLSRNGFSFFAVKAESGDGKVKLAKVLHGDLQPPYTGEGLGKYEGYGFGPAREDVTGLPHFKNTTFTGQFPLAQIDYDDADDPFRVRMTAFNPFIPLNEDDSSLPCALFEFEVWNRSPEALDVSVAGILTNPHIKGAVNRKLEADGCHAIHLTTEAYAHGDPSYGNLTLATDQADVSYQTYLYRGQWFDNLTMFWKDFTTAGALRDRLYDQPRDTFPTHLKLQDGCVLCARQSLAPGESRTYRFTLAWHFPNYVNYWNPGVRETEPLPSWKNYYAALFADSFAVTRYVQSAYGRLRKDTFAFHEALYQSSMPREVLDAVASNLSILKSSTVARLPDGTLYGFEGVHAREGSCEGSCTHVWNYEQATAFLFPSLARSMRNIDYEYCQFDNGKMAFRMYLPPERTTRQNLHVSAADGQMGGIMKTYREWKISGDTAWLREIWPQVRKALEYAWSEDNECAWDADKDGVMEGRQHHTLDMELFGPNAWLTGLYLAALKAAAEMAEALGEADAAAEYRELFERGAAWTNEHLFNGEYYDQQVDIRDRTIVEKFGVADSYWNAETGEIKYQIAGGCGIDQVIGQWFAHLTGLGEVLDPAKVRSAVQAIYRNNFARGVRERANTCRIYALNDESGLMICTWPNGDSPVIPVPYADECMHGFEYQAASHLIYEGFVEEGLQVARAVRERYDGIRRNPWNEIECGSNYVRSMASYGLLLALSGFEYDMTGRAADGEAGGDKNGDGSKELVGGHIGFNPKLGEADYRTFWSLHEGWGNFRHQQGCAVLEVAWGSLSMRSFASDVLGSKKVTAVRVGNRPIPYSQAGRELLLREDLILEASEALEIRYE